MAETQTTTQEESNFIKLMRLGHIAFSEGDFTQAHLLWKHAAMLEPDSTEVWWSLLQIVKTDADKRICLSNILVIEPHNREAQAMLDMLIDDTQPAPKRTRPDVLPREYYQRFAANSSLSKLVWLVLILAVLVIIATIYLAVIGQLVPV